MLFLLCLEPTVLFVRGLLPRAAPAAGSSVTRKTALQIPLCRVPVDDICPVGDVVRAEIVVLEIIGVFPDIAAEEGSQVV